MSTRSFIGYIEDNKLTGIYCHFDGYISHNGKILYECYNDINKIKELIQLGDLSSLGEMINPTEQHSFDNPQKNVCVAYHRDRDEDKNINVFNNIKELKDYCQNSGVDYIYVFVNDKWIVIMNWQTECQQISYLDEVLKIGNKAKLITTKLMKVNNDE